MSGDQPLMLANVVATMDLGRAVNDAQIAIAMSGRYDPARFPAVLSYVAETQSSAQCFSTGRVVIVGCKTEDEALLSAWMLVNALWRVCNIDAGMLSFSIRNIVCSINLGYPINLDLLYMDLHLDQVQAHVNYVPEQFPGISWYVLDPESATPRRVTIAAFATGKGVATGIKSMSQLAWVNAYLVRDMRRYRVGHEYRQLEAGLARKVEASTPVVVPHSEDQLSSLDQAMLQQFRAQRQQAAQPMQQQRDEDEDEFDF